MNDESNHAISNTDDTHKELSGKDSDDGSSTMPNDTNSPDEVKKPSAIDASSTNEDDDSGNTKNSILIIRAVIKTIAFMIFP